MTLGPNRSETDARQFSEWHPDLQGYSEFYNREIRPSLIDLESARKRNMRKVAFVAAVSVIVGLCLLIGNEWVARHLPLSPGGAQVIGLVGGGLGLAWAYIRYNAFAKSVKELVLEKTCAFLGLNYEANLPSFPLARFEALNLVPSCNKNHLEDALSGNRNGVDFTLIDARLDSSSNKEKPFFEGLLIICKVDKPFRGQTVLTDDYGWLNKIAGTRGIDGERVRLEDPRFEKVFEVFGSDQVEARYILTPTLMEKLLKLSGHVEHGNLRLAFVGHEALLAVNRGKNQFELGSMTSTLDDPTAIQSLLNDISMALWVVDETMAALSERR